MKTTKILVLLFVTLGVVQRSFAPISTPDPVRTAFTYQGHLYDANHVADGLYDFQFKLFDSLAGSQVGDDVNVPDVDVIDAQFTVELDFGNVYDGNERWLEISVRPGDQNDPNIYTVLEPRQEITATPYALYALNSGSGSGSDADWMVSGNDMYSIPSGNVGIGTTSPEFKLTLDNDGGIIAKGTYGSGSDLTVSGAGVRLIWYPKKGAFRAGMVSSDEWDDPNIGDYSTAIGYNNTASGYCATIGGGYGNTADASGATISGGVMNTASDSFNTIGGGNRNTASGSNATIGGGFRNEASGSYATVGGGGRPGPGPMTGNIASGDFSTVSGGGGIMYCNTASGNYATVGGGSSNTAGGLYATVPGGIDNIADANYSFAAGRRAKANHDGSFVWADSTDANFASTGNDQFLIRASGGVGIGTTSPQNTLDVTGAVAIGESYSGTNTAPDNGLIIQGDVGIGTSDPSQKLTVDGGDIQLRTLNGRFLFRGNPGGGSGDTAWLKYYQRSGDDTTLEIVVNNDTTDHIALKPSGNVGIKTDEPAYDLDVIGDIRATGSVYYGGTEGNANGTAYNKPDYVFEDDYDVMSVEQVEEYLKKENHLPWMTSAKQEKDENSDVIDMTRMAFETVETAENLQIQIIELNKLIKEQAKLIEEQQKRIAALEARIQMQAIAKEVQQ